MLETLLILFCILFTAGIFLDYQTKKESFKKNESETFLNSMANQGIIIDSILSEQYKFYTHPLWKNRNFVHKTFISVGGEYFLYMRCGDGNPVIQEISKERAHSSLGV